MKHLLFLIFAVQACLPGFAACDGRVRNSMKGGSGIGLSIVKKIIEDHGGYIWATSKEGEGTCLHFVIRKYREAETDE